ncbi:helicase-related protein [Agromyces humi]|uniref:helicase-related protein n=1 Tax=Agromyces humi TaxID=1766800 RepID=UPI0013569C23|nr:helicase-related protein [Agromyces humi]
MPLVDVHELAADLGVKHTDLLANARAVRAHVSSAGGAQFIDSRHIPRLRGAIAFGPAVSKKQAKARADAVAEAVTVNVRARGQKPATAVLHLGPTNSGKTYDALHRLAGSRTGTYAAPLRMLAREAYQKLVALVGADGVGLITGEESISPDAPIICCTVEMAPMAGDTLVVDEAHWAADPDRGYAWTRLLLGGDYDLIEVAANRGAEPFLRAVLADVDNLTVQYHDRLAPLHYAGQTSISDIPDRSLLVAFSRRAVLELAGTLTRHGRRVGVLYGALPPETRAAQIDAFIDGHLDVMVTTDVIGHGINVPAEHVIFAETTKFDGNQVRPLLTWEAAQIAGRAGRYGLTSGGTVRALRPSGGYGADKRVVRDGTEAAAGRASDGLHVTEGKLRPTFADLGSPEPGDLGRAIAAWGERATELLAHRPGVEPLPVNALVTRYEQACRLAKLPIEHGFSRGWNVDGVTLWQAVAVPVNTESPAYRVLIDALTAGQGAAARSGADLLTEVRTLASGSLEDAEQAAATSRDLMMLARSFPDLLSFLWDDAAELERTASQAITKRLGRKLRPAKRRSTRKAASSTPTPRT